jgi:glycosyltransferase involved in cell wall biosynthesis
VRARPERPLVVTIPSYQNARYWERNLQSVLGQDYANFRVLYTDDASTDGTAEQVAAYAAGHPQGGRLTLLRNATRRGAMANLYRMVHACADHEVVLTVDGDDWLAHPLVLKRVNETYADEDVWITWGQYRTHPDQALGCAGGIPPEVVAGNAYRDHDWRSSHLRTFRAWLFKRIAACDLMIEGEWAPMAWDVPMMFAMLEMSGEHGRFLDEVLYVYNDENPLNEHKLDRARQQRIERHFRARPRYARLAGYSLPTSSMPEKK